MAIRIQFSLEYSQGSCTPSRSLIAITRLSDPILGHEDNIYHTYALFMDTKRP